VKYIELIHKKAYSHAREWISKELDMGPRSKATIALQRFDHSKETDLIKMRK